MSATRVMPKRPRRGRRQRQSASAEPEGNSGPLGSQGKVLARAGLAVRAGVGASIARFGSEALLAAARHLGLCGCKELDGEALFTAARGGGIRFEDHHSIP